MGRILVKNLGKAYKQYPNRFSRLKEWLIPGNHIFHEKKWVLQDINFEVKPGEAVGIIGINGAGKSTLLKLITGTIQPTTGSVEMTGRVASMLELGMGFHPDFTGRQNVYMAGQLLGMTGEEITEFMPKIEEFAEIGDYIDQPVRVYSSGMQVRLAFSIATAIRPDILIVDEALSVGDTYFQHKCIERIRQYRKKGTTLLIVSHDKGAIQAICDRAIMLDNGKITLVDTPDIVLDYYNAKIINKDIEPVIVKTETTPIKVKSGNGRARIIKIQIRNKNSSDVEVIRVGELITIVATIEVCEDLDRLVFGYQIKDRLGQPVYGINTKYTDQVITSCKKDDVYQITVEFCAALGVGSYSIATALVDTDGVSLLDNYEWDEVAKIFTVINSEKQQFVGYAWLPSIIKIELK